MTLEKIGYGTGSKDFDRWPNVLRVWLGEESEDNGGEGLVLLETNIDDMSPQVYGYLMEKLLAEKGRRCLVHSGPDEEKPPRGHVERTRSRFSGG